MNDAINALTLEIARSENLSAYYANRALRQRLALEELLHLKDSTGENDGSPLPESNGDIRFPNSRRPSAAQMIRTAFSVWQGPFTTHDIRRELDSRWPQHSRFVRANIGSATLWLVKRQEIKRVGRATFESSWRPL